MSKINKERARLHKLYHRFYDRHYIDELHSCFYCNSPSDTLDHSPPLSWIEPFGLETLRKSRVPLSLLPCCKECNSLLSNRKLLFIDERLEYLLHKYNKIFDQIIRWTDDEIDEMGPSFQSTLRARQGRERILTDKIRSIEQRTLKPDTWPTFVSYPSPENDEA